MERYKNLSGNSGVREFEIGKDFIVVVFESGASYLYHSNLIGYGNLSVMQNKAISGRGLCTFIAKNQSALPYSDKY